MAATANATESGTGTSVPTVLLKIEVIEARAAEILGIPADQVTQQHLAQLFNVNQATISRLVNGKFKPGLDTALAMASALKIPVEDFAVRVSAGE